MAVNYIWAGSLVGRARLLHRRGREFESLPVHCVSIFGANPLVREGLPQRLEEVTVRISVYPKGKTNLIELMAL